MISVITDIALDHQEYLGETIAEIAREKAGILRPHGTLVTLPRMWKPTSRSEAQRLRSTCMLSMRRSFFLDAASRTAWSSRQQRPFATEYLRDFARWRALACAFSAGRRASAAQHRPGDCGCGRIT